ncbi:TPR-like protein [Gloeophyllum trabeum ATCC 11539]|uniref:TPR-like protein n=1 Tax=Gloeophyllum trabeum (strain ATCC 11539 / FP-39264 / Madison 617) TaxID=670483 RepID=S7QCT5_GLOTA|nr:TPR-like protein [Gloeophyllum trabeum ATCC 11539]EPQ57198.1 TPR-like protein [Gloeophyllum trabeum ATCC 11539]
MSLQGLISGSECALPANPLSQVLKHTEGDRSLQQDRVAGPSSSRLHHLPASSSSASEHQIALARAFFDGSQQSLQAGPSVPRFRIPPPELSHIPSANASPALHRSWVDMEKGQGGIEHIRTEGAWAAEFGLHAQNHAAGPSMQQQSGGLRSEFEQRSYMSNGMYGGPSQLGMYGMNYGTMYNEFPGYGLGTPPVMEQDKGKGKSREVDFDAAFAEATASLSSMNVGEERTVSVTEVPETRTEEQAKGKVGDTETKEFDSDFRSYWDSLSSSDVAPAPEDLAKWEAEFNQLMNSQRDESDVFDYGESMQKAWESGLGDFGDDSRVESVKFDDDGLPIFADFPFEQDNKYLGPSTSDRSLLDEAKALLAQNGSLSEASLMLEAAIQKGELGEGGYEAWILLGETRNMDEREETGMRALAEGVKRAQEVGAAPAGMLSLAISYTNESYDRAAHTMLLRWLEARFPSLPIPEETLQSIKNSSWDSHQRITDLFLQVARSQHAEGTVDPDVQIGLGVMFYTKGDFERAKDCFESALNMRPEDYLLWNRLGSCLSNGNKPEEALGAYREALSLRPTYTRAIYNVGVACLNIGAHKEAVEHFLSALAMQDSSGAEKSEQLWFTLRRAFIAMGRSDLAEQAKSRPKVDAFRNAGFDF